jgi:16S rRNA (cytosine967-C5)-methyltransferase
MKDIRVVAATVLATVIRDHRSFAQTLSAEQAKLSDKRDIGFLNALCFGVARRYWPLTASLASLLNKPLKPKDTDIQALLLTGLYQLWFMDVPDYAAVASAVEAARTMGKEWACGLVNKLLRKAMEEKEVLQQAWASNEELYFSHPRWLIDEMKVAWPEDWESVLLANAERAPLTLRVQTSRISRDDYARRLMELGIHSRPLEGAKQALLVHNSPPITELPGFVEGLFYVQDLAGQWVVDLLDLAPGQRVLDACAAPGS